MAAATATNAVWSFGLGGMEDQHEEDDSKEFGMYAASAASNISKMADETEETLDSTDEDVPPVPASSSSSSSNSNNKQTTPTAVWSFGLGGEEQDTDDDDDDDWGCWGSAVDADAEDNGGPIMVPAIPFKVEDAVKEQNEKEIEREQQEKAKQEKLERERQEKEAKERAEREEARQQKLEQERLEQERLQALEEAPRTPTKVLSKKFSLLHEEDESEGSMEFTPIASTFLPPESPGSALHESNVFTINEDEEEEEEEEEEDGGGGKKEKDKFDMFASPVSSPKKPLSFGKRPQTVGGALRRPRYGQGVDNARMTPRALLSKMTPNSAFKRASDLASLSVKSKQKQQVSRSERMSFIQSSFRNLDLNNDDSFTSLPQHSPIIKAGNNNNKLDEKDDEKQPQDTTSPKQQQATTTKFLPQIPMGSDEFGASNRTQEEESSTNLNLDESHKTLEDSGRIDDIDASEKSIDDFDESPGGTRKKKKNKVRVPKSPKKSKDGDEASTSTKKKKKKGLKKAMKQLASKSPVVGMTELVRDTSDGVTGLVTKTAKGTKNLVTTKASDAKNLMTDSLNVVSNTTSDAKNLVTNTAKGVGEQLGIKKKKKKKDKDNKDAANSDDVTASSKKSKKSKKSSSSSSKSSKKSKSRKLVDAGKNLKPIPSSTERPVRTCDFAIGGMGMGEKQDSFSSHHSAQSFG